MGTEEAKTISFSFSYNDIYDNQTTISKVLDLDEEDETGILTLLEYFTVFLQLSEYDYVKSLQISTHNNHID